MGFQNILKRNQNVEKYFLSVVCPTSGAFFLYKLHMVLDTFFMLPVLSLAFIKNYAWLLIQRQHRDSDIEPWSKL